MRLSHSEKTKPLSQENLSNLYVSMYVKENEKPTVIVPLGSLEVHEYLPMGIDSILAKIVAERIAGEFGFIWSPVLPFGHSPEHIGPGVVWFRPETYIKLLDDIIDSYVESGFKRIIFLNCHAGNAGLLKSVILCNRRYAKNFEISKIEVWDYLAKCFNAKKFGDYCIIENSLALYFGLIDKEKIVKITATEKREIESKVSPISPWLTSEIGNVLFMTLPKASEKLGKELFECVIKEIISDIRDWIK